MITANSSPIVSIITPLLKIDSYFKECAESVFTQTESNIEWIIVTSLELIKEVVKYNEKNDCNIIKPIVSEDLNCGVRRNIGIDKSEGKYILFLDSDDNFYDKYSISKLVAAIERYECNAVGASCVINDLKKGIISRDDLTINKGPRRMTFSEFQNESGFYRFIFLSSFLKNKHYFSNLVRFQDSVFLVKTLIEAKEFYVIPDIVYAYRKNHKQVSWNTKMYKDHINGVIQLLEIACQHKYKFLAKKMLRNIVITTSRRVPNKEIRNVEFYEVTLRSRRFLKSNLYAFVVSPFLYILAMYKLSSLM